MKGFTEFEASDIRRRIADEAKLTDELGRAIAEGDPDLRLIQLQLGQVRKDLDKRYPAWNRPKEAKA